MKLIQKRESDEIKNPNTSDLNIYALIGTMLVSTTGIGYAFKKRFN